MMETDIAYIAGLMDGEAYIGIKRSKPYKCQGLHNPAYHARIQIRMVDEPAIKFIADNLGGKYYKEKSHSGGGRVLYCWQASDKLAAEIISIVLPYLRVKRKQAETVLALRAIQAGARKYRTKVTGERIMIGQYGQKIPIKNVAYSDEYIAICEAHWQRCHDLNFGLTE